MAKRFATPILEADQARFWAKVALPNEQGCVLWLRSKTPRGYGKFWLAGRLEAAHRVSYVLAYGPIPDGLEVDHVKAKGCANRHCVAPLHLEAVTGAENTRRGDTGKATSARQRAKTHCPTGHEYTPENTRISSVGARRCRICQRAGDRRRYHERKEAA